MANLKDDTVSVTLCIFGLLTFLRLSVAKSKYGFYEGGLIKGYLMVKR